ncbi:hypothetical protein Tco_0697864 [Tanacetum coccineum]
MMLLAQEITQKFSTPTNNRLRTSSNIRNQAVIQDGRVAIETKNAGYGRNGNRNAGRQNMNQAFNVANGLIQNDEIIRLFIMFHELSQIWERQIEQMLLAMKDEAGSNLKDKENDFMLDSSFGDETLEELTAVVIMMAHIQPANDNAVTEPIYDAKAVSEVNASHKMIPKGVYEHKNHGKRKIVINASDDDQIDSNIIFNDPYVENNGGTYEHDSNAHEEYHDIQILAYNSIQTIHVLGKTPNKVYDPFLKAGLGYQNPERLKKAIAAQPKMYHGEMLQSTKLKIDSPDSEETLKDVEESRLKIRNKMIQLDYGKLNALMKQLFLKKNLFLNKHIFQFLLLLMSVLSQKK